MKGSARREKFERFKMPGSGNVNLRDITFLHEMIKENTPKTFLELGVASGFSTAFIIEALAEHSPTCTYVAIDQAHHYYLDESKPVGFLIDEMIDTIRIDFSLHTDAWVADAVAYFNGRPIDAAFIDANHAHPWPTIDTMLLIPLLRLGAEVGYHDIELYKVQPEPVAIGPHYLYHGIDDVKKDFGNIGSIRFTREPQAYEEQLLSILRLDWTVRHPINAGRVARINNAVVATYTRSFAREVEKLLSEALP